VGGTCNGGKKKKPIDLWINASYCSALIMDYGHEYQMAL
jgi:hypothetical protein